MRLFILSALSKQVQACRMICCHVTNFHVKPMVTPHTKQVFHVIPPKKTYPSHVMSAKIKSS